MRRTRARIRRSVQGVRLGTILEFVGSGLQLTTRFNQLGFVSPT